jgi:hypothetical protein
MKPSQRQAWAQQLDLFQPAPRRMTWTALPVEVQQEVKRLLARMFNQHLCRSVVTDAGREESHER